MNFENVSNRQLLEFYNMHADKPVRKFSNRKDAERRVSELCATKDWKFEQGRGFYQEGQPEAAGAPPAEQPKPDEPTEEEFQELAQKEMAQSNMMEAQNDADVDAPAVAPAPANEPIKDVPKPAKPYQTAKQIMHDAWEKGVRTRKDLIQACVDQGIKYNTADGAHYEVFVKGKGQPQKNGPAASPATQKVPEPKIVVQIINVPADEPLPEAQPVVESPFKDSAHELTEEEKQQESDTPKS